MAKVIDKPTTIKRPIKRPTKTPDEYNDLVLLQRIVVNANRVGDLEYAEIAQARIDYLNSGMREELRTEFKRIMQVYEELLSEKNNRVTHATYTWTKVASKGEKQSIPPAETVLFGDRLPRKHVALRLALRSVDAGRGSGRG
jgi:hypothetical protein